MALKLAFGKDFVNKDGTHSDLVGTAHVQKG